LFDARKTRSDDGLPREVGNVPENRLNETFREVNKDNRPIASAESEPDNILLLRSRSESRVALPIEVGIVPENIFEGRSTTTI
jgi:hypothetical protein